MKRNFSQDTMPLAVRCFNVASGIVSWKKIPFNRLFKEPMLWSITYRFQNGITHLNQTSRSIVMGLQSFGWADGHGGRPWWTRRWKTLKKRPSMCFSTSYPLWHASRNPPLDSKVNVLISGTHGHECFSGECS
jgi:hypothetical protein